MPVPVDQFSGSRWRVDKRHRDERNRIASEFFGQARDLRQSQVWESLSRAFNKEPYTIRRMLTEGAVKSSDRRAVFVGIEAYEGEHAKLWGSLAFRANLGGRYANRSFENI